MKRRAYTGKRPKRRWPFFLLGALALIWALTFVLQTVVAHWTPAFVPDYTRLDLAPVLSQDDLAQWDFQTIFEQTGLARPAAEQLHGLGDDGIAQILSVQDAFWDGPAAACTPLFDIGKFSMEDRLQDDDGQPALGPPMPALEPGDVLVTFSTHTFGWRHGHAAILLDEVQGISLEAAVMGTDSAYMDANHWRTYSNFMVLRLKDMTPELRQDLFEYCTTALVDVPYRLTSGVFGPKAPQDDDRFFGVHCSYLVWYAFEHFGYDVDGDGGRIVTVADLAQSPLFEIVQVYGIDPRTLTS